MTSLLPLLAISATAPVVSFSGPKIDRRVNAILAQMTLEEKIGQLVQFSYGFATGPDNHRVDQRSLIEKGALGSILNATGAKEINSLQKDAVEKARLKIPLLFGLDVIHGYRTIFPIPLALSASWNEELIEKTARVAAVEATADGIRWTFSPMVDVARDARWGRVMEGAGEDPYLGCRIAGAYVRGYQGKDLADPTSMVACAKHFAAYGGVEAGREYNSVDVSDRALHETYLPPYRAAVDAGVGTFMSAFNTVSGVPASASRFLMTDVLRRKWNFKGFVVSDWNSIGELIEHGTALDLEQAAEQGLNAGVDMDMAANAYASKLVDLVKKGRVKEADVNEAARRVLRVKVALGLFEKPFTDEARAKTEILSKPHLDVAREAAEQSFVLLKNDQVADAPLLPLAKGKKIALIGPLADSADDMLGEWAAKGEAKDVVTLRHTLSERIGGDLLYAKGTEIQTESEAGFAEALATAKQADVVVMALGESRFMSGESFSRTRIGLPGNQLDLLKAVVAAGKPVVLVVFSGRPLTLPWEAAHVPAILEAWFPGVQAGPALTRVLFGDVAPVGRLTASFPRAVGQLPLYYNHLNTGRPGRGDGPNQRFLSTYLDERTSPLFPFGWGLTYTNFEYGQPELTTKEFRAHEIAKNGEIVVEGTVKNTGSRPGTEIVQCYIRQRGATVARPVRELKGFQRVTLAPGESKRVRFVLTKRDLQFLDVKMKWAIEPTELTVWIAPHAQAGDSVTVRLQP